VYIPVCLEVQRTNILPALLSPVAILQCSMIQRGSLYYSTKIHALQKPIIRITVCAKTYKFTLRSHIAVGVSDHKCMFIQLSISHNKQLVNVSWQLLSALRMSHHQANTQEQTKQKLCTTLWWRSPSFHWKTHFNIHKNMWILSIHEA